MKLSLALTNYNRYEMLLESFDKVLKDDRISEIVISDDCSERSIYDKLVNEFQLPKYHKVKMFRNEINVNMSRNKFKVISYCENQWAILFDSDNIIDLDYLDALETCEVAMSDPAIIFMPDFAKPGFNYTKFGGNFIDSYNAGKIVLDSMGNCCFNTANYVVNRDYYMSVYKHNPEHLASDTIWHNLNHLKYGGSFYVVPTMEYFHRQHPGSGFLQDININMANSEKVRKLIMAL